MWNLSAPCVSKTIVGSPEATSISNLLVPSYKRVASPAIASDPVTVTNVLSVEPVRATELDPAPMSDKTCVPVL